MSNKLEIYTFSNEFIKSAKDELSKFGKEQVIYYSDKHKYKLICVFENDIYKPYCMNCFDYLNIKEVYIGSDKLFIGTCPNCSQKYQVKYINKT